MDALTPYRSFFAHLVTANAGVRSTAPALMNAFSTVPRERFLGPGPWKVFTPQGYIETPSADPALVYQDITVALKEAERINNGQPTLHARCLDMLNVAPGETVVHIGTGTGYYTAILAELAAASGHVYGFEIDAELAAHATENLREYQTVTVFDHSGATADLPETDVIYVSAGATGPLDSWLDSLRPGGRLMFPLTASEGAGGMLLITRSVENRFDARFVLPVMFIPCIGARRDDVAARLADAFKRGDSRNVRSLRRNTPPDDTCWCRGDNWWLSTAEAA